MNKYLLLLLSVLLLTGCASKRYTKKANQFEEAGLYKDAADYYYEAVKRKDSNVDAKLGLRKNGQLALDQMLTEFQNYYKQSNQRDAVYSYLDARKYYHKINAVGVNLTFPESNKVYYEEVKSEYLNQKYGDGIDKLNRDEFNSAYLVFKEILDIDNKYRDTKEKLVIAKYEPKYREANSLLENGLYRKAYYTYKFVLDGAGDYKQAMVLKEEAREKGTITILVNDFTYTENRNKSAALSISSKLRTKITELNNPFIQLIDPSALNVSIHDDGNINLQAANLAGIHSILTGNLSEYYKKQGKVKRTRKKGYIKEVTKIKTEAGTEVDKPVYHKTEYFEFRAQNNARINVTFQLIATENSAVLVTGNFDKQKTDKVHYATFDGNKNKLIPGSWKYKERKTTQDIIKDDKNEIKALRRLLDADRKIKSSTSLLGDLVKESISKMASKINSYNPEDE